jgi:thiol-disulfide isomerase/thioredoxin
MCVFRLAIALLALAVPALAQQKDEGPGNEKARKTYQEALKHLDERKVSWALDELKHADKQDGGHCIACQKQIVKYAFRMGQWRPAELAAEELVVEAQGDTASAQAHYQLAYILINEGMIKRKEDFFARAHEAAKALAAYPNFPAAVYLDGGALAHLHQDEAAKARFQQYVKMQPVVDPNRQRVLRYISDPELARARLAPPFTVTTLGGQDVTRDSLLGKVVLLDFWATWCRPCRAALPHMRQIAEEFAGQPLVILSVSLDNDEEKWQEFVAKHGMTWLQCIDGGFKGPMSKMFGVAAIPHTFTIDADGVIQDEHLGYAAVEDKLKKLVAQAREIQSVDASSK